MHSSAVITRAMRQDEYDSYTSRRDLEYVESLAATVPADVALEKARQDRARFLPQGLATEGHRHLVAENAAGQVVGHAWVGLGDPRTGAVDTAWLYDISVEAPHRRSGYGRAILAAVETAARQLGATRLGLNVFGGNTAAIALYRACGYEVTSQQMAKPL